MRLSRRSMWRRSNTHPRGCAERGRNIGTATQRRGQRRNLDGATVRHPEQLHTLRLNEFLDPLNPALREWLHNTQYLMQQTGDAVASIRWPPKPWRTRDHSKPRRWHTFDVFWVAAVLPLALILLVFVMKPSAAGKGEPIGAD